MLMIIIVHFKTITGCHKKLISHLIGMAEKCDLKTQDPKTCLDLQMKEAQKRGYACKQSCSDIAKTVRICTSNGRHKTYLHSTQFCVHDSIK